MKGIDSLDTGAHLVHVPGWVDGIKSRFKDCLQQSKMPPYWCPRTTYSSYLPHWISLLRKKVDFLNLKKCLIQCDARKAKLTSFPV
jgi:hypothetical protein